MNSEKKPTLAEQVEERFWVGAPGVDMKIGDSVIEAKDWFLLSSFLHTAETSIRQGAFEEGRKSVRREVVDKLTRSLSEATRTGTDLIGCAIEYVETKEEDKTTIKAAIERSIAVKVLEPVFNAIMSEARLLAIEYPNEYRNPKLEEIKRATVEVWCDCGDEMEPDKEDAKNGSSLGLSYYCLGCDRHTYLSANSIERTDVVSRAKEIADAWVKFLKGIDPRRR